MKSIVVCIIVLGLAGCHFGSKPSLDIQETSVKSLPLSFLLPESGRQFTNKDSVPVRLLIADSIQYDSIRIQVDGARIASLKNTEASNYWLPRSGPVGAHLIEAVVFKNGIELYVQGISLFLFSGTVAQQYTYKVKSIYPHDPESYTQGLTINNGILYEGTGLYGHSTLRIVDMKTGKVLKNQFLADDIFGEGVEVFDNNIIQLSWKEHIAFLYDKKSFSLLKKFSYLTEGWGITSDGTNLIMSDGSSNLYFLNKESFTLVRQLTVVNEKHLVNRLNELEYINGEVWANVYTTDTIVRINPKNGEVISIIDMSGLLPAEDHGPDTDVLNGIAFDKSSGRIYVTGKKWPKLYEITLVSKK